MSLKVGVSSTVEVVVEQEGTASAHGSGSVDVFATPALVALLENVAMKAAAPYLDEGYTTVGTRIDVKHLAATPVGMKVIAKAELVELEGKRLVFKVEARDEAEVIGEGMHERYIVGLKRFMERVNNKGR